MSAPPNPDPLESDEARTIPDDLMVFRSSQAAPSSDVVKNAALKSTKMKLKDRKSTPRPILKGVGRKRFSFSPSPESKQSFKKSAHNDLNEERGREPRKRRNLLADLSEVAGVVNIPSPEPSRLVDENLPLDKANQVLGDSLPPVNECREMVLSCSAASPTVNADSPEPGLVAGGEVADGREKVHTLHHLWSKTNESSCSNGSLVGVEVKLPEMELGTNPLLESCLEPCHNEMSHDALAVTIPMQPKKDNLLLLANMESVEMLDTMTAQPLLAGGQPEGAHLTGDPLITLPLAEDPPLLTLVAANSEPMEMSFDLFSNSTLAGGHREERQPDVVPHPPPTSDSTLIMPNPAAAFEPSSDEFPPLERGRTLKIRDSFETGDPHHGEGSARPRNTPSAHAPRDSPATKDPYLAKNGANTSSSSPKINGAAEGPRHVIEPRAKVALTNKHPNSTGTGTSRLIGAVTSSGSAGSKVVEGTGKDVGNANIPRSMADLLRGSSNPSGPQVFEPEKI